LDHFFVTYTDCGFFPPDSEKYTCSKIQKCFYENDVKVKTIIKFNAPKEHIKHSITGLAKVTYLTFLKLSEAPDIKILFIQYLYQ
jgi:hypothetical protein